MGLAFIAPLVSARSKDTDTTTTDTDSGNGECAVTPTETEGPCPTKNPSSYLRSNIVDGQAGVPLTVRITVNDTGNNCNALAGARAATPP